jgi:hypothetical protein
MSITAFLAVCVLGFDFMIYVLFQWTYGDKRSAIARQVAVQRNALKEQAPRQKALFAHPLIRWARRQKQDERPRLKRGLLRTPQPRSLSGSRA